MINKINFQARSIKLTILLNKNFQGTQNIFYSEKKCYTMQKISTWFVTLNSVIKTKNNIALKKNFKFTLRLIALK